MAVKRHILSKSTFMYGCQCPLRLFYHKFKPELKNPEDEGQESIFAAGTNVGILAQGLFPGGVNAEPPDPFSYHVSAEKTQGLIKEGVRVIYEAAFNFDGVLCAIDILVKRKGKWFAYEVKGTKKVKPQHEMDASMQYWVMTNAGIEIEDFSIVHLNGDYVRMGDLELEKLFRAESVLERVKENQAYIGEKAEELKALLKAKIEPVVEPGDQCFKPYECDFTLHCWKNVAAAQKERGEEYLDKEAVQEFLDEFEYPLYFFDFETIMPAVPEFDYSRPYQQVPFQYSLHVLRDKDEELEHLEFLGNGVSDPRLALIKQLLVDIGTKGSVVAWHQTFEIGRLKELARDFPMYGEKILAIIDRVVDLMVPFRSGKMIYLPGFEGSWSIKKVLPVMVPELSYDDLEVQDGGTASLTYAGLKDQTEEVQKVLRGHLLEYCGLDTLAMVRIWERIEVL
jgi:hypothetical protein